jgi:hypothetical protein
MGSICGDQRSSEHFPDPRTPKREETAKYAKDARRPRRNAVECQRAALGDQHLLSDLASDFLHQRGALGAELFRG